VGGLVHENSTLHIGRDGEAVVGLDYRPNHVENVHVTGGALWPTTGSWNPTMTMVALAQDLADNLLTARRKAQEQAMKGPNVNNRPLPTEPPMGVGGFPGQGGWGVLLHRAIRQGPTRSGPPRPVSRT
jgi:hypothetical protein